MTSTSADELVTSVRRESGLSQRALAERVGCSRSTIARIESGDMDPTVTMLARITSAAGRQLEIRARPPVSPGSRLADAADGVADIDRVDWTRLRALVDRLTRHPGDTDGAIADPPARTGDPRLDNLLAATAEQLADDAGRPRPRWTTAVAPLPRPWHPPGTPRMQAHEAATAPAPFAARNVLLGLANLWRPVARR
jgi:transcriptional regulator with XRE-family HTH domain